MRLDEAPEVAEDRWCVGELDLRLLRPLDAPTVTDPHAESTRAGPVWARVWPSARGLAGTVAGRRFEGARFLELGCGLGLVSLVAAAAGARVLATDRSPYALAFAAASAERNGLELEFAVCDWQGPSALVTGAPWDVVAGADLLYDLGAAKLLLDLLPRLVDAEGEVLIADPGRDAARLFLGAASVDWSVSHERCAPDVVLHRLRRRRGAPAQTAGR